MAGHKIGPGIAEEEPHNAGAQFDVCLTISSFHIILAQVPKIMYCEGDPQSDVPWGPEKASPGKPNEPEMQPKRMGTKEHTSSSDSHSSPLLDQRNFAMRREAAPLPALTLAARCIDVADIRGAASCSDLVHIACTARRLVRCSRRADGDQAKRNSAASLQNTSPLFRARAIRHSGSDHPAPCEIKPLRKPTADVAPDFTRMSRPSPALAPVIGRRFHSPVRWPLQSARSSSTNLCSQSS